MKKHLIIIAALLAALGWVAFHKTAVDRLMASRTAPSSQSGMSQVELPRTVFPTTPAHLAEPGLITVVYFRDANCPACAIMDSNLNMLLRLRPDVAVRKVAIQVGQDAYSEAIRDWRTNIWASPFILIYDQRGKAIALDDKLNNVGFDLLNKWIEREARAAQKG